MVVTTVNIARDFSDTPGGRHRSLGPASGEEFRDHLVTLLEKGQTVFVTESPAGYVLTPYDPALEQQIDAGRAFMREYRDTFHQLAK